MHRSSFAVGKLSRSKSGVHWEAAKAKSAERPRIIFNFYKSSCGERVVLFVLG